jgi:redox-sensing transcriptional repressor
VIEFTSKKQSNTVAHTKEPQIPRPTIARLCAICRVLDNLVLQGSKQRVSSSELGKMLGSGAHNVRKDINYLGGIGTVGSGYDIRHLRDHLRARLGLNRPRNTCVVGLGRLGAAVLNFEGFSESGFAMVAGFDSSINRLETIATAVEVFPAHEIPEIVRRKNIELAILAVPASAVQETADRCIEAGIRGIVNFTPVPIICDRAGVFITHVDVLKECAVLSAFGYLEEQSLANFNR